MGKYRRVVTVRSDAKATAYLQAGWEIFQTHLFRTEPEQRSSGGAPIGTVPVYTIYIMVEPVSEPAHTSAETVG